MPSLAQDEMHVDVGAPVIKAALEEHLKGQLGGMAPDIGIPNQSVVLNADGLTKDPPKLELKIAVSDQTKITPEDRMEGPRPKLSQDDEKDLSARLDNSGHKAFRQSRDSAHKASELAPNNPDLRAAKHMFDRRAASVFGMKDISEFSAKSGPERDQMQTAALNRKAQRMAPTMKGTDAQKADQLNASDMKNKHLALQDKAATKTFTIDPGILPRLRMATVRQQAEQDQVAKALVNNDNAGAEKIARHSKTNDFYKQYAKLPDAPSPYGGYA